MEILEAADGIEVDQTGALPPAELAAKISAYDGLIIRSGSRVTAEVIDAATNLKVIGRAGIGVDNIDVQAATKKGIVVMNTPAGNNVTTAEHAISMMLALARQIPQATASMKSGKWEKNRFVGSEVFNKTLGSSASATSAVWLERALASRCASSRTILSSPRKSSRAWASSWSSSTSSSDVPTSSPYTHRSCRRHAT
jgi:hypothetical protein